MNFCCTIKFVSPSATCGSITKTASPYGARNYLMCQFPFPIDSRGLAERWNNLAGYQRILVNSSFTRDVLIHRVSQFHCEIAIDILPPADPAQMAETAGRPCQI